MREEIDPAFSDPGLDQLLRSAGEGIEELETLAGFVAEQMIHVVTRMIYASFLRAGKPEQGGRYVLYLEGSIARSPVIRRKLLKEARELLIGNGSEILIEDPLLKPYQKGEGCTDDMLKAVDTTLAGTASMIIADCVRDE